MFELFSIDLALVTLILFKADFIISAFPTKIIFGQVQKNEFSEKSSFIIKRSNYGKFCNSMFKIISSLSTGNTDAKGEIVSNNDFSYGWKIGHSHTICFYIEKDLNIIFSSLFSLEEFNHLLHCFAQLITSSLLLRTIEAQIILNLSKLSLKQIMDFSSDKPYFLDICKANSVILESSSFSNLVLLIENNIDIIIILHKLQTLVKTDYLKEMREILL